MVQKIAVHRRKKKVKRPTLQTKDNFHLTRAEEAKSIKSYKAFCKRMGLRKAVWVKRSDSE